jgi:valyl-tRNA synthetase
MLSVAIFISAHLVRDEQASRVFGTLQDVVRSVRNIRAEYKTEPGKKLPAVVRISVSSNSGIYLLALYTYIISG